MVVKFCVFLGREKNMKILHSYIKVGLEHNIINEYHMFNFSRNISDNLFIIEEYNRLSNIFPNRIFKYGEYKDIYKKEKPDWNLFYSYIANNSNDDDVIIKCDDDILFIDILSLQNAIDDRINDKASFIIHSNCINNGVCAYYQKHLFPELEDKLSKYPTGGILGILFEKPEIAYSIHNQFGNDIILNLRNLNKYIIKDKYITSRISINFVLINGSDAKYLGDITYDDEYELSSLIPEKLLRPNKIKGDLITSHLSYSFQDKIILHRDTILDNYKKIRDTYINIECRYIDKFNDCLNDNVPTYHLSDSQIFIVRNWIKDTNIYIKNIETNKYIYIDYEIDELCLSDTKKTMFEYIDNSIKLGIYYLTKYNSKSKIRNEKMLIKYLYDKSERAISYESNKIKFLKYNSYLSIDGYDKWIFEKVIADDIDHLMHRTLKNNKFYYTDIKTGYVHTNYYLGWGINNILY